jgi:hypothetical protein
LRVRLRFLPVAPAADGGRLPSPQIAGEPRPRG